MKITKSIAITLITIFSGMIPLQTAHASYTPKIIVQYVGYANCPQDTSNYKIHEDTIIENATLDSKGYYTPDVPDIYGYHYINGGQKQKIEISENVTGRYYIMTIHYNRIMGNDNPPQNLTVTISKKGEVKDLGYWEQKDGSWYFIQQRVTELVSPIGGEASYYCGYSLNGVGISAKDGDYEKHYKTGPCWIKPDAYWYHLDSTGKMETGWIHDGGNWYFCWSNGQMAADTYVYGHYVDENGVWDGK